MLNTYPDPGFWWAKIVKNLLLKNLIFFWSKIAIYLSLGLHKGRQSYRRSLQPSKENIKHFETLISWLFSIFVGHFCPPGSVAEFTDSDWGDEVNSGGGLFSHRPARLHGLADRYDNPMPKSTLFASQGSMNSATDWIRIQSGSGSKTLLELLICN